MPKCRANIGGSENVSLKDEAYADLIKLEKMVQQRKQLDRSIFRHGRINNHECIFGDSHTTVEEVGEYKHRYYITHHDQTGNPAVLTEEGHCVNFWGTAFFKKPLKWGKYPGELCITDWYWDEEED